MQRDLQQLPRFTAAERANHWLVSIAFILVALSGLVFFHPLFYPLSALFGGGTWTRILHPFIGLLLMASFGSMFLRFRDLNTITETDKEWLGHIREMIDGDDSRMPEAGKFNGGQKLLFWLLAACMVVLTVSGIIIWRSYFTSLFPVVLIRIASVAHAAAGAGMLALIIGHIYAAIWTKESIDAMLYGRVRRAWAKQHHPAWFRQITGGDNK